RFEPEAALGELVHALEELHGALEHTRKIEQRSGVERALILRQRHGKDSPDAARHHHVQVAAKRPDGLRNDRRDRGRTRAMPFPRIVGPAIGGGETSAGEALAAWTSVLGEEIPPHAIDERAKRCLRFTRLT